MAKAKEVHNRAFALYCAGVSIPKVAKLTGITERWLYEISKRNNWPEKRIEHEQLVKENVKNSREIMEGKLLDSIESVWVKLVNDGLANASARDVIEALKYRRLKDGLSTENIAVKGELTIEERYRKHLERKKKLTSGDDSGFVKDILPVIEDESK